MEKLTCTNCGGKTSLDETGKYAVCPYCGTRYKLDKDINFNINIDQDLKTELSKGKKFLPLLFIPFIFIFLIIIVISFSFFKIGNHISHSFEQTNIDDSSEDIFDKIDIDNSSNIMNEIIDKFSASSFNNDIELYAGKNNKFFLEGLLEKIVTSNKKNPNHLINVIYEDKNTSNPEEITEIKYSLTEGDYEISLDYDSNGYINVVTITKR